MVRTFKRTKDFCSLQLRFGLPVLLKRINCKHHTRYFNTDPAKAWPAVILRTVWKHWFDQNSKSNKADVHPYLANLIKNVTQCWQ